MRTPVQTKGQALTIIESHQEQLKTLGVKRIGLFGSFLRDQQKLESDVDLIVEFQRGKKDQTS